MTITITAPTQTTTGVQNVSGSDGATGFFFTNGWISQHPELGLQNVQPGWTVVGNPTWVVTSVDINNQNITITGGEFLSGAFYAFTGSGGITISSGITIN